MKAYFFQGDALLTPANCAGSEAADGLPLEFAEYFKNSEIFEIPAVDEVSALGKTSAPPPSVIRAVSVLPETPIPENWQRVPVRQFLASSSAEGGADSGRILRACHISQWRQISRFCGTCGARNEDVPGDAQRICPVCGRSEFPRICPAIIVAITDDDGRILLAHNKRFRAGIYSHISGFNEAGETLEATVVREVREEVNIEIKDIVYIKSQPWPFPNSLMLGFKARYLSGTLRPDGEEIEDAKWFSRDNLPELPGAGSLSRYIIGLWLENKL